MVLQLHVAGQRDVDFVDPDSEVMFGGRMVQTVDVSGKSCGGIDEKPVIGELQDVFRERHQVHLTKFHRLTELLSIHCTKTREISFAFEYSQSLA